MVKRICDKCGKEIQDNTHWFLFKVDEMTNNLVYCCGGHFELCENCCDVFMKDFANKT